MITVRGLASGEARVASPLDAALEVEGGVALPGIVNSHDHLDFGAFPRLATRTYADYVEWAEDIHRARREEVAAALRVPEALRVRWGLYKNLLAGVTTVVHHGDRLAVPGAPLRVWQEHRVLHSAAHERRWRLKLAAPTRDELPVVVHAGEGTSPRAREEIDALLRWNVLGRRLIAVHGVAMTEAQAVGFEALVWCPASNAFLLGATADVARLSRRTSLLFGTDSTLTAPWDLWAHVRGARGVLDDAALLRSLTDTPARVWRLPAGGDLVVATCARWTEITPANLALVVVDGAVRLADEERHAQLGPAGRELTPIGVSGVTKYVQGNLRDLLRALRAHGGVDLPPEVEG